MLSTAGMSGHFRTNTHAPGASWYLRGRNHHVFFFWVCIWSAGITVILSPKVMCCQCLQHLPTYLGAIFHYDLSYLKPLGVNSCQILESVAAPSHPIAGLTPTLLSQIREHGFHPVCYMSLLNNSPPCQIPSHGCYLYHLIAQLQWAHAFAQKKKRKEKKKGTSPIPKSLETEVVPNFPESLLPKAWGPRTRGSIWCFGVVFPQSGASWKAIIRCNSSAL